MEQDTFSNRLRSYLSTRNLFRQPSVINNRHQLRNQIISTRLYILLFPTIIFSILLYLLLLQTTIFVHVNSPTSSDFSQLYIQYKPTLHCPCTNISIPYERFLSLEVNLHQICLIDLNEFINNLFNYTEILSNNHDFRFTAALQFRLLNLFCSVINETITNRLIDFMKIKLISSQVLSESQFQSEIDNYIDQFIHTIKTQFINSIEMIQINTYGSQITSGVYSNYKIFGRSVNNQWSFWPHSQIFDNNCNCSTSFLCTSSANIFDQKENILFEVPGFRIGCFILDSLLVSSLECFYNTTCIIKLKQYIRNSDKNNLSLSLPTRFNHTDTIQALLNELMIENWKKIIDYNVYYQTCQVQTCFYSYHNRYSFLYIIIFILSAIGGFNQFLRYWIPLFVRLIRHKRSSSVCSNLSKIFQHSIDMKKIRKSCRLFNLFRSRDSHSTLDIRNEFWSTRIYILIFIPSFILLIKLWTPIINYHTISIPFPTLEKLSQSKQSIICSCSTDAISFGTFINLIPKFHSICSSDFISDEWIRILEKSDNEEIIQFRIPFRLLSLFCHAAKQTFNHQLEEFYNNLIVNTHLLSLNELESRINSSIEQMIVSTRSTFVSSFKFVRDTMSINGLLSASDTLQNSADFISPGKLNHGFIRTFNDEICYSDAKLTINETLKITLTRFYTKCDGIVTLLNSSLISLYNKTNVQFLSDLMN